MMPRDNEEPPPWPTGVEQTGVEQADLLLIRECLSWMIPGAQSAAEESRIQGHEKQGVRFTDAWQAAQKVVDCIDAGRRDGIPAYKVWSRILGEELFSMPISDGGFRPEAEGAPRDLRQQREGLAEALRLFFKVNEAGIERGTTLGEQLAVAGFFDKARAALAALDKDTMCRVAHGDWSGPHERERGCPRG